jgi:hypothetical protein
MSLSLWNWGNNPLQYQEDIVEAEFKEIAWKGARVSLAETQKCGENVASQSENGIPSDGRIDRQRRFFSRAAREKTDRRIMFR